MRLTYTDAQCAIDGKPMNVVPATSDHETMDVVNDVRILNELAKKVREDRYQKGYLGLHSMRLTFGLDENGFPSDTMPYERLEAHKLIEEVRSNLPVHSCV